MEYLLELDAVQRFIKAAVGLNSWRRTATPSKLARPVIIWEAPYRGRARHLSRWSYTQTVKYYAKLYVSSVDESLRLQNGLVMALEDLCGTLPILDNKERVGWLKNAVFEFTNTGATEDLDIPFTLAYEVSYARTRPQAPPAPTYVGNKVTVTEGSTENE